MYRVFLAFFFSAHQQASASRLIRQYAKDSDLADATQDSSPWWPTGCRSGQVLETEVSEGQARLVELKFIHRGRCRAAFVTSAPRQASNRPVVYMFHGSGPAPNFPAVRAASRGCSRWLPGDYLCVWVQSDEDIRNGQRTGVRGWETHDGERTPNRGDVDFVRTMHNTVSDRWELDSNNVFAFGHSSGAMFVIGRLHFEAGDVFRGIVATAGRLWSSMPFRTNWKSCVHIQYNYAGQDPRGWGPNHHGRWGPNYGIEASALRLAEANDCRFSASGSEDRSRTLQTRNPEHIVNNRSLGGRRVTQYIFPGCSDGQSVSLYNWTDQGHSFGGVREALDANMMSFFEEVRQSSACGFS